LKSINESSSGVLFKLPVVIVSGLTIKNYTLEKVENFKYTGFILDEDNNHQIDLQERIENANKTYFMLQNSF
jgi:hypothetical protein